MSRHYFETTYKDHPVTVLLGWDRPLGHYFLVIEKQVNFVDPDVTGFDDQYLYSNLYESNPFGLSLEHFKAVLHRLKITVPANMFTEVQRDSWNNVGNRDITHQADGSFAVRSA